MIQKINLNSVNNDKKPHRNPEFKGMDSLGTGLLNAIQACEKQPMLNVTVLDLFTAIGPRSIYDTIKTNIFMGLETLRRESSGLLINCIIPGFIVAGFAKLLQKHIMKYDSKMHKSNANEETVKFISHHWENSSGQGEQRVKNACERIINDLYGNDGKKAAYFSNSEHKEAIKKIVKETMEEVKYKKGEKTPFDLISEKTFVTEHLKTVSGVEYGGDLKTLTKEMPKIFKEFLKQNITEAADIEKFIKKSNKLITAKSLLGLGVIIPLAILAQPINRWITAKTSGKKGAPIYRDFAESEQKELSPEKKASLNRQKLISVASMIGVALLSIMKKPDIKMLKEVTQFKGLFPTMDQARIISTATFASRMMASEDENELREATVRDIATFSAFYFLGDYVAKGIAMLMPKYKLINQLEKLKPGSDIFEKFWHWTKHTSLKASSEIASEAGRNMRAVCQLGNIGFSLVALGLLIPMITRNKTDKNHEEELKKMGVDKKIIEKYYPPFAMNNTQSASTANTYKAFFTAK